MKTMGERIKAKRVSINMSQEELAFKLGYRSRSSINKIEVEGRGIPNDKVREIAIILNTTPEYILGWEEKVKIENNTMDTAILSIPLYEGLSCGTGAYVDDVADDFISIPSSMLRLNKDYFANYASGDSMINQNIHNGDLIIFEKTNHIENGQVGSFILGEDDATCKIFKQDNKTGLIMLLPANNAYDPIPIEKDNEAFRVVGKLALVINNRQNS